METLFSDEYFMQQAIKEAAEAQSRGEIPVGAVVVMNNRIIAKGSNRTEALNDVTAHAEIEAITSAANYLGAKYLTHCTLFVTLEPCVMCAGALGWSQIARVVYGAADEKRGFLKCSSNILHPKTQLTGGVLSESCANLMVDFFKNKRGDK